MGWASASELANNIWAAVSPYIPEDKVQEVALTIVEEFESMDADTLSSESEALYAAAYPWNVVEHDGDYIDVLHNCTSEEQAVRLRDEERAARPEAKIEAEPATVEK